MTDYTYRCTNCHESFTDETRPHEHGQCPTCGSMQIEKCPDIDEVSVTEPIDTGYDVTYNDTVTVDTSDDAPHAERRRWYVRRPIHV